MAPIERKKPNGSFDCSVDALPGHQREAGDAAQERGEKERDHDPGEPEEGADHRQHLDVAVAEPLDAADGEPDRVHRQDHAGADRGSDQRPGQADPAHQRLHQEADRDPRDGDAVGQDEVLEIDQRERDHGGAEDRGDQRAPARAEAQVAGEEERSGGGFDHRVAPPDRARAVAAAAAQQEEREDGDVVAGADPRAAAGAARRRQHRGDAARQSMDDDVEVAARDQAENGGVDREREGERHRSSHPPTEARTTFLMVTRPSRYLSIGMLSSEPWMPRTSSPASTNGEKP